MQSFFSPHATIGNNVQIGCGVHIHDHVIIEDDCIISDYCVTGHLAGGQYQNSPVRIGRAGSSGRTVSFKRGAALNRILKQAIMLSFGKALLQDLICGLVISQTLRSGVRLAIMTGFTAMLACGRVARSSILSAYIPW